MVAEIRQREMIEGDGGLELACDRWPARGANNAGDVLFLHGFGQTRHAWQRSAATAHQRGHQVISADARGHGESEWLEGGDYQLSQLVEDARCLAKALDQPVAVGASMGGLTALVAEAESPTPVFSALVLVDITPNWDADGVQRILNFMSARPEGFESVAEAAEHIARYLPHRDPRQPGAGLSKLLHADADGRLRWHWDPALMPMAREAEHIQQRLIAAAQIVTVPTMLISGSHSDVVTERGVRDFLNAVPHAQHRVVANARHLVTGDENDAFNQAVFEFLEQLNGSAGSNGRTQLSA